jgi:hypothetical protein
VPILVATNIAPFLADDMVLVVNSALVRINMPPFLSVPAARGAAAICVAAAAAVVVATT